MPELDSSAQSVLFIGLGAMGSRMAPHLAATDGLSLSVSDQNSEVATEVAASTGARAVPSADVLASLADIDVVILMLPDSDVVESLVTKEFFDALGEGGLIVDMGSSRPASTVVLADAASGRGIGFVDAPVSGGTAKAAEGTLSIMVGGSDVDFGKAEPLLQRLGSAVTHVGGPGAGHALKSLNNLLSAIGLAAASEVLAIGSRFGLRASTMLDVINSATGRNQATEVKFAPFILSHTFDSGFAMKLMVKDLSLALDLAEHTETSTPIAQVALAQWKQALEALGSGADHTQYAGFVEQNAKVTFE